MLEKTNTEPPFPPPDQKARTGLGKYSQPPSLLPFFIYLFHVLKLNGSYLNMFKIESKNRVSMKLEERKKMLDVIQSLRPEVGSGENC